MTYPQAVGPVRFGLLGSGWRAEFYLRIAQALPDRFQVGAVASRSTTTRQHLARTFGVATVDSLGALLDADPGGLVVTSVPWARAAGVIRECAGAGMPVLSETPPADSVYELLRLWDDVGPDADVAVAEEYPWRPQIDAVLRIARSGRLGEVGHVHASVGYRYHAVAVIRRALGVGRHPVTINAHALASTIVEPPGRDGPPGTDAVIDEETVVAMLQLAPGRTALFDFSESAYFSPIRHTRLTIRGSHGEVDGATVRWASDVRTAYQAEFRREQAGIGDDLRGAHLVALHLGAEEIWRNPYAPARLSDDEIAVATVLESAARRFAPGPGSAPPGGDPGYTLADGCHDHEVGIAIETAARDTPGEPVITPPRPWHEKV